MTGLRPEPFRLVAEVFERIFVLENFSILSLGQFLAEVGRNFFHENEFLLVDLVDVFCDQGLVGFGFG